MSETRDKVAAKREARRKANREAMRVAARQWGVLSHAQAIKAGLTADQVTYRLHTGRWRRAANKVYVVAGTRDRRFDLRPSSTRLGDELEKISLSRSTAICAAERDSEPQLSARTA